MAVFDPPLSGSKLDSKLVLFCWKININDTTQPHYHITNAAENSVGKESRCAEASEQRLVELMADQLWCFYAVNRNYNINIPAPASQYKARFIEAPRECMAVLFVVLSIRYCIQFWVFFFFSPVKEVMKQLLLLFNVHHVTQQIRSLCHPSRWR